MPLKPFLSFAAIVLSWLLNVAPCYPWSDGGHKVVALIAYSQLDEETRAKIVELLEQHPLWESDFENEMPSEIAAGPESERQRWIFAQAAIWPDIARKYTREPLKFHHGTWHYINDPIFIDQTTENLLAGHLPLNLDFEWTRTTDEEFQNAPQTIAMALKLMRDPRIQPSEKAVHICWLFHLGGDLHQPLHCATLVSQHAFRRGDRGGNSIKLRKERGGGKSLHSFWDALLKTDENLNEASGTMQRILHRPGVRDKAVNAAANINVKDWVSEGKELAKRHAYTEPILAAVRAADRPAFNEREVVVTLEAPAYTAYAETAGNVAGERAAIGGYRLATLLKKALE